MDFYSIVRPEHLNQYDFLFGGVMLQWVDEYAYIAAANDFPGGHFVTRAMDRVEFTRGVVNGAMVRFHVTLQHCGVSSASYLVEVYSRPPHGMEETPVFRTVVTMVTVDDDGHKTPLPPRRKEDGGVSSPGVPR